MVYRLLGGCLYFDDDGKMPRKTVEVREPPPLTQTTTRLETRTRNAPVVLVFKDTASEDLPGGAQLEEAVVPTLRI